MIDWIDNCVRTLDVFRVRIQSPFGICDYVGHDQIGIVIHQEGRTVALPWSTVKFLEVIPS